MVIDMNMCVHKCSSNAIPQLYVIISAILMITHDDTHPVANPSFIFLSCAHCTCSVDHSSMSSVHQNKQSKCVFSIFSLITTVFPEYSQSSYYITCNKPTFEGFIIVYVVHV